MTEKALSIGGSSEGDPGFKTLQELIRHGYEADPNGSKAGGILVRHSTAPDLVVQPDGVIRLAEKQSVKQQPTSVVQKISWRRGVLFLFLLAAYTLISAFIIINITAD